MVSFNDCEGNPGALRFMSEAYAFRPFKLGKVEAAFSRVINAGVRGADLYILWNDCCDGDTEFALEVMSTKDLDEIKAHIAAEAENGRGTPFER